MNEKYRECIEKAERDLGPLSEGRKVELLLDNFPVLQGPVRSRNIVRALEESELLKKLNSWRYTLGLPLYDHPIQVLREAVLNHHASQLIKDVQGLSDGTLATLTGTKNKSRIQEIQGLFLEFTRAQIIAGRLPMNGRWQDAWELYEKKFP